MRLGCYFGMTSPMILIASKKFGIDKVISFSELINRDKNLIINSRKEMIYFLKSLDEIPKTFKIPTGITPIENFDPSARFVNNKLFGNVNEEDFMISFTYELIVKLLNDYYKSGKQFSLEVENVFKQDGSVDTSLCLKNRTKFINFVREKIAKEDFYLSGVSRIIRKIARSLKSNVTIDYKSLAESFNLISSIPDKFIVNGDTVIFSQEELNVVKFFTDAKQDAEFIIGNLIQKNSLENSVFGRPFRDVCTSNPRSIYRTVQSSFDLVKDKGANFITSLLNNLTQDLEKFREQFTKEVLPDTMSETTSKVVPYHKLRTKFTDLEKQKFFDQLFFNIYVDLKDVTEESFQKISELYDVVKGLEITELNDFFHLKYTQSEWNDFISRLNKIGICGINLFSMDLFRMSLESLTFVSDSKIYRSVQDIEEFNLVLDNVQALITTIKPIGTPL